MTRLDVRYRAILLPHLAELRLPGRGIDLNMAEELLAPHGLRDLNRAERVGSSLVPGDR